MTIWMEKAGGVILLLGNSLVDIKLKRISLVFTGAMAVIGAVLCFFREGGFSGLLPALLPGLFFILLSVSSRGGIGMGDGIVLTAAGFFRTWEELLAIIFLAVFLAGAYAAVLFLMRRQGEERFAFVPFLFLADVLLKLLGG